VFHTGFLICLYWIGFLNFEPVRSLSKKKFMSTYRPGGFQILPPVIKNLLIINVIVFLATVVLKNLQIIDLDYYLGLFHWNSPLFKPWQPITHMFMHGDISHLFFNMFALWMFGNVIENVLGSKRFILFYLVCGLGAAACYLGVFSWEHATAISWFNQLDAGTQEQLVMRAVSDGMAPADVVPMVIPMMGASGAIYALLFAFGYLFPNMMIYIYFLFPLKAKYFVAIYAIIELLAGLRSSPGDNVAHFAHLGGMLFAFILLRVWNRNNRNTYYY